MFEGLATMVLTPAMALIQDDWVAQKIEQKTDKAWTKHPETNSCFDVTCFCVRSIFCAIQ